MAKETNIRIKRIYEPPARGDGYRILVDRLWPRGIKKEESRLDEWNKTLAPSAELRKWFNHEKERFAEFSVRYKKELLHHKDEMKRIREIGKEKVVTLLYGAKDENANQAVVLREVLGGK